MDINRLLSDELDYELTVRGLSVAGCVDDKRKRIRGILRLEKMGIQSTLPSLELDPASELEICSKQLGELESAIHNFNRDNAVNERQRILSRIYHITGRLSRIADESVGLMKSELLSRVGIFCETLECLYSRTQRSDHQQSILDEPNELLPTVINANSTSRELHHVPTASLVDVPLPHKNILHSESETQHKRDINPFPSHTLNYVQANPTTSSNFLGPLKSFETISKWNLQFDGNSSVTAFISRIEELRSACGITKEQLFRAAIILFSGAALVWFRVLRIQ